MNANHGTVQPCSNEYESQVTLHVSVITSITETPIRSLAINTTLLSNPLITRNTPILTLRATLMITLMRELKLFSM
jgi:hypothetical protein